MFLAKAWNNYPNSEFLVSLVGTGVRIIPLNHKAIAIMLVVDDEGEPVDMSFEHAAIIMYDETRALN